IASAEEHHTEIEDRLLFPALAKAVGRELPLLVKSEREHQEVKKLVGLIRSGSFDNVTITAFIDVMRKHLEREIHDDVTVVDAFIPAEQLISMSNWDVEHVYVAYATRQPL